MAVWPSSSVSDEVDELESNRTRVLPSEERARLAAGGMVPSSCLGMF
eukprot:CAMPEP_0181229088 /NCGR_PEP_ID=MMETSP1096-20121128/33702_1 /TAXON_ID=156174 ORGANISM="Chrysochromulina ericina, Strain CCMP281" /NCGR_SAMPLE_ID=MMETSP1096 /ASSEMBLY_ACC=CAM_ASM_000453 /LENGTH=46 /DNA_ID= /DNA_START= /DNA_END= /DNA_ORIENTATION=